MTAIMRGMSSTEASVRYGIPQRTLQYHMASGIMIKGHRTTLTQEQEVDLVNRLMRCAKLGTPITSKIIRLEAFAYCKEFNIPNTFNKKEKIAGLTWLHSFLQRNSELKSILIKK